MIRIELEDGTLLDLREELGDKYDLIRQIEVLPGIAAELVPTKGVQKMPVPAVDEESGEAGVGLVDVPVRGLVVSDPAIGFPVIFAMPEMVAFELGAYWAGQRPAIAKPTAEEIRKLGG